MSITLSAVYCTTTVQHPVQRNAVRCGEGRGEAWSWRRRPRHWPPSGLAPFRRPGIPPHPRTTRSSDAAAQHSSLRRRPAATTVHNYYTDASARSQLRAYCIHTGSYSDATGVPRPRVIAETVSPRVIDSVYVPTPAPNRPCSQTTAAAHVLLYGDIFASSSNAIVLSVKSRIL